MDFRYVGNFPNNSIRIEIKQYIKAFQTKKKQTLPPQCLHDYWKLLFETVNKKHLTGLRNSKLMADGRKAKGSSADMKNPKVREPSGYVWKERRQVPFCFQNVCTHSRHNMVYLFVLDVFFWRASANSDRFDVWFNQNGTNGSMNMRC